MYRLIVGVRADGRISRNDTDAIILRDASRNFARRLNNAKDRKIIGISNQIFGNRISSIAVYDNLFMCKRL